MLATLFTVASIVVSCKNRLDFAEGVRTGEAPLQRVENMFVVQTDQGRVQMRVETKLMEHFVTDTNTYDSFPQGIAVYSYSEDGRLEAIIVSNNAKHIVPYGSEKDEIWEAFGDVIIHNVINHQTMETDTIYWDRTSKEIYTDCYVKMYSPDGFMQGYGMRSDDRARNAILHRPFNGYASVVQDSTVVIIDSVNFIGPFPKK